jgi:pimeloyl-ACP methyl ester carboxylesterase
MKRFLMPVLLLCAFTAAFSQSEPLNLNLTASDGTKLKATYFAAAKLGPAVILLHMCNTDRRSWEPVARQLSAAGINALTIDNRGFGESGGPRAENAPPDVQQQVRAKWPGDFDTAFEWILSQPGVDKNRIGAGGGSCGVNNAVKLASRHPEVRSLVLLAGATDPDGLRFLQQNAWMPLFTAAAADDEYDNQAPEMMRWFAEFTGNVQNKFVGFQNGRHGTEIFGPHPELPKQIVAWYVDTLLRHPADAHASLMPKTTPVTEFWAAANQPGGAVRAAKIFHDARKRDANAFVFPEFVVNVLAYQRLQAAGINAGGIPPSTTPSKGSERNNTQAKNDALELFKLNVEAFPTSANAEDSLADGYLALGQNDRALAAERKCLELLRADKINDQFKSQLRQAAEQRIAKLKQSAGASGP